MMDIKLLLLVVTSFRAGFRSESGSEGYTISSKWWLLYWRAGNLYVIGTHIVENSNQS